MVKNDDGTCSLFKNSKANQQSKEKGTSSTTSIVEDGNQDDEYYEVEKVLEVRLNKKFHSEEYRVRFKGYTSENDMWLPSSAVKEGSNQEAHSEGWFSASRYPDPTRSSRVMAAGRTICSSDGDHVLLSLSHLTLRFTNWNIFILMATSYCGQTTSNR